MTKRSYPAVLALAAGLAALGCGGGESGRYRVSGSVTYEGKPVPYGRIYFDPDPAKNKAGLQGMAEIKDGKFDTAAGDGKGTTGGAVILRIDAFETAPPQADSEHVPKRLFPEYRVPADLPQSDTTKDVSITKADVFKKVR